MGPPQGIDWPAAPPTVPVVGARSDSVTPCAQTSRAWALPPPAPAPCADACSQEEEGLLRARQAFTQARYRRRPDQADDTGSAFLGDERSVNDHNFFRGVSGHERGGRRRTTGGVVGRGDLDVGGLTSAVGSSRSVDERSALLSESRRHLLAARASAMEDGGYFMGALSGDDSGPGESDAEAEQREGADPVERGTVPSAHGFSPGDASRLQPGVLRSFRAGSAQKSRGETRRRGSVETRDIPVQDRSGGPLARRSAIPTSSGRSSSTPMLVHLDEETPSDEAVRVAMRVPSLVDASFFLLVRERVPMDFPGALGAGFRKINMACSAVRSGGARGGACGSAGCLRSACSRLESPGKRPLCGVES